MKRYHLIFLLMIMPIIVGFGFGGIQRQQTKGVTYIVAASNSLNKHKADYICDGTNDEVQIQAAIDALPGTGSGIKEGGTVQLSDG